MAIYTPDSAKQTEERIKVDVQKAAPDSNPYLAAHWLRSVISGLARRIFDLYRDLRRTEARLMPDTADAETAPRWGNVYLGPPNVATGSVGVMVATGTAGGAIPDSTTVTSAGVEYTTTAAAVIADVVLSIATVTRSGDTATVTTASDHGLSSFVPVTIAGADQTEYNITDAQVVVTGADTFTYTVAGSPATPATGSVTAGFTAATVPVASVDTGDETNLAQDTAAQLGAPIVNVDNTLYVTYAEVSGGTGAEALPAYKARYLEKMRQPVANFNDADIRAKAKEVAGVTRVFVQRAGSPVSTVAVVGITRDAAVATVTTAVPHLLHEGQFTTIAGAGEIEYNVTNARVIVADATTFSYTVAGSPATPATGAITATQSVPLGMVLTYFMRDNDPDPIPSPSAVAATKAKIEEILPANTATGDNVVLAPVANVVDFVFSNLTPDNPSMREAVDANIAQFFEERTTVGGTVDEDAYRAAIKNTVDPANGATVDTFTLLAPVGDIPTASNAIATKGDVTYT